MSDERMVTIPAARLNRLIRVATTIWDVHLTQIVQPQAWVDDDTRGYPHDAEDWPEGELAQVPPDQWHALLNSIDHLRSGDLAPVGEEG